MFMLLVHAIIELELPTICAGRFAFRRSRAHDRRGLLKIRVQDRRAAERRRRRQWRQRHFRVGDNSNHDRFHAPEEGTMVREMMRRTRSRMMIAVTPLM